MLRLDTANGAVRSQIDRHRTETTAFYPSPDGKRALAADYGALTAYGLESGRPIWHVKQDDYDHAILPDGSSFVGYGQTIRLRSMATGLDLGPTLPLGDMPGRPYRFIVSPDGRRCSSARAKGSSIASPSIRRLDERASVSACRSRRTESADVVVHAVAVRTAAGGADRELAVERIQALLSENHPVHWQLLKVPATAGAQWMATLSP